MSTEQGQDVGPGSNRGISVGQREIETAAAPGAFSAFGVGAGGEMPIEDDATRRQSVERRCVDPAIAVRPDGACLQAAEDEYRGVSFQ